MHFYRSEHEHNRCPKARALEEGVGPEVGLGVLQPHQPALQHSLFTGRWRDSPQVFPDFNEFGGVVLFLFWWFFQLKERGKV